MASLCPILCTEIEGLTPKIRVLREAHISPSLSDSNYPSLLLGFRPLSDVTCARESPPSHCNGPAAMHGLGTTRGNEETWLGT